MHVDEEYAMIGLLSLFAEQVSCPVEGFHRFLCSPRQVCYCSGTCTIHEQTLSPSHLLEVEVELQVGTCTCRDCPSSGSVPEGKKVPTGRYVVAKAQFSGSPNLHLLLPLVECTEIV